MCLAIPEFDLISKKNIEMLANSNFHTLYHLFILLVETYVRSTSKMSDPYVFSNKGVIVEKVFLTILKKHKCIVTCIDIMMH